MAKCTIINDPVRLSKNNESNRHPTRHNAYSQNTSPIHRTDHPIPTPSSFLNAKPPLSCRDSNIPGQCPINQEFMYVLIVHLGVTLLAEEERPHDIDGNVSRLYAATSLSPLAHAVLRLRPRCSLECPRRAAVCQYCESVLCERCWASEGWSDEGFMCGGSLVHYVDA